MWLKKLILLLIVLYVKGDVLQPEELVYEKINFENEVRTTSFATEDSFYFAYVDYNYLQKEHQINSNVTFNKIQLKGDLFRKTCDFQFHVQSLDKSTINPEINILKDGNVIILYEDELDGIDTIRVNTIDMKNCKVKNTDFVMRAKLSGYNLIPYNDTFDFIVKSDILDCNGKHCVFTYNLRGNRVRDPITFLPEYEFEYLKIFNIADNSSSEGYFAIPCATGTGGTCTIYSVNSDGSYKNSVNHTLENNGEINVFHKFEKYNGLILFTIKDQLTEEYNQFYELDKTLHLEKKSGYIFGPRHFVLSFGTTKYGKIIWIHAPITDYRPGNFNIKKTGHDGRIVQSFIYNDPKDKLDLVRDPQFSFHDMGRKLCFEIYYPKSCNQTDFNPTWSIKCFNRTIFWH